MIRLFFDENFNQRIVRGVQRRVPEATILTVQKAGLAGTPDPELLEWAANEQFVLVTSDVQTMIGFAYERLAVGLSTPGVFVIPALMTIGEAIEELVTILRCSDADEWEDRIVHLPI
jgi:Domain of unknown function (DUF5615)